MQSLNILIELLSAHHDRAAFDCGEESLNVYLHRFARQNATRGFGVVYVAVAVTSPERILGYYTLASSSIARDILPENVKLPRYPVPSVLIGRLAVDKSSQGQRVGEKLVYDIVERTEHLSAELGIHAIEVQALHERARAFYERFNFMALLDDPLHLYLPMETARRFHLSR